MVFALLCFPYFLDNLTRIFYFYNLKENNNFPRNSVTLIKKMVKYFSST